MQKIVSTQTLSVRVYVCLTLLKHRQNLCSKHEYVVFRFRAQKSAEKQRIGK